MDPRQHQALSHLRDVIEDHDLLQRDVEERVGWRRGALSRLLNGRVDLRVRHLETLLGALGVSPAEFFGHLFARPAHPMPGKAVAYLEVGGDVVNVYSFGIRAVRELSLRVDHCERALSKAARSGVLDECGVRRDSSTCRRAWRG